MASYLEEIKQKDKMLSPEYREAGVTLSDINVAALNKAKESTMLYNKDTLLYNQTYKPSTDYKVDDSMIDPRFGQSKYDKRVQSLSDYSNLDDLRANEQGAFLKAVNATAKAGIQTATTFGNLMGLMTYGVANGISSAAKGEGFLKGFIDNPVSNAMREIEEWSEKALPNYRHTWEQEASWYKRMGTVNFWFDDVLKNVGFSFGSVAAAKVATKGTMALVRGLTKSTYRKAFETIGKKFTNKMTGSEIKKIIADASKAGVQTAEKEAALKTLAKLSKTENITAELTGSILGAVGESQYEALGAMHDFKDKNKAALDDWFQQNDDHIRKMYEKVEGLDDNGNPIDYETFKKTKYNDAVNDIDLQSRKVANSVFAAEVGLLTATNYATFKKFFSGGYRNYHPSTYRNSLIRGALGQDANEIASNIGRRTAKDGVVEAYSKMSKLKKVKAIATPLISEGPVEEMGQNFINKSADFYHGSYLNEQFGYVLNPEYNKQAASFLQSIQEGAARSYGDKDEWIDGFAGAIFGGLGLPTVRRNAPGAKKKNGKDKGKYSLGWEGGLIKDWKDIQNQSKLIDETVNAVNTVMRSPENVKKFQNLVVQLAAENKMDQAALAHDMLQFKDEEMKSLMSTISTFRNAGMDDVLDSYIDSAAKDLTDENIDKIKPLLSETERTKPNDEIRKRLTKDVDSTKRLVQKYREINDNISVSFGNSFTPRQIDALTGMLALADYKQNRAKEILQKHSKIIDFSDAMTEDGIDTMKALDKLVDVLHLDDPRFDTADKMDEAYQKNLNMEVMNQAMKDLPSNLDAMQRLTVVQDLLDAFGNIKENQQLNNEFAELISNADLMHMMFEKLFDDHLTEEELKQVDATLNQFKELHDPEKIKELYESLGDDAIANKIRDLLPSINNPDVLNFLKQHDEKEFFNVVMDGMKNKVGFFIEEAGVTDSSLVSRYMDTLNNIIEQAKNEEDLQSAANFIQQQIDQTSDPLLKKMLENVYKNLDEIIKHRATTEAQQKEQEISEREKFLRDNYDSVKEAFLREISKVPGGNTVYEYENGFCSRQVLKKNDKIIISVEVISDIYNNNTSIRLSAFNAEDKKPITTLSTEVFDVCAVRRNNVFGFSNIKNSIDLYGMWNSFLSEVNNLTDGNFTWTANDTFDKKNGVFPLSKGVLEKIAAIDNTHKLYVEKMLNGKYDIGQSSDSNQPPESSDSNQPPESSDSNQHIKMALVRDSNGNFNLEEVINPSGPHIDIFVNPYDVTTAQLVFEESDLGTESFQEIIQRPDIQEFFDFVISDHTHNFSLAHIKVLPTGIECVRKGQIFLDKNKLNSKTSDEDENKTLKEKLKLQIRATIDSFNGYLNDLKRKKGTIPETGNVIKRALEQLKEKIKTTSLDKVKECEKAMKSLLKQIDDFKKSQQADDEKTRKRLEQIKADLIKLKNRVQAFHDKTGNDVNDHIKLIDSFIEDNENGLFPRISNFVDIMNRKYDELEKDYRYNNSNGDIIVSDEEWNEFTNKANKIVNRTRSLIENSDLRNIDYDIYQAIDYYSTRIKKQLLDTNESNTLHKIATIDENINTLLKFEKQAIYILSYDYDNGNNDNDNNDDNSGDNSDDTDDNDNDEPDGGDNDDLSQQTSDKLTLTSISEWDLPQPGKFPEGRDTGIKSEEATMRSGYPYLIKAIKNLTSALGIYKNLNSGYARAGDKVSFIKLTSPYFKQDRQIATAIDNLAKSLNINDFMAIADEETGVYVGLLSRRNSPKLFAAIEASNVDANGIYEYKDVISDVYTNTAQFGEMQNLQKLSNREIYTFMNEIPSCVFFSDDEGKIHMNINDPKGVLTTKIKNELHDIAINYRKTRKDYIDGHIYVILPKGDNFGATSKNPKINHYIEHVSLRPTHEAKQGTTGYRLIQSIISQLNSLKTFRSPKDISIVNQSLNHFVINHWGLEKIQVQETNGTLELVQMHGNRTIEPMFNLLDDEASDKISKLFLDPQQEFIKDGIRFSVDTMVLDSIADRFKANYPFEEQLRDGTIQFHIDSVIPFNVTAVLQGVSQESPSNIPQVVDTAPKKSTYEKKPNGKLDDFIDQCKKEREILMSNPIIADFAAKTVGKGMTFQQAGLMWIQLKMSNKVSDVEYTRYVYALLKGDFSNREEMKRLKDCN